MSNDNKIFGQGLDNGQKLKLSQPINQYDQGGSFPQEKKSIFGDKKPNDNYSDVSNRSRAQSNLQPKQSISPSGQDGGLFFKNPMSSQNQGLQQGNQIQTLSGQQSQTYNPNKQSNVYDNALNYGNNNKSLQQSQVISLSSNNYVNPQQQNRMTESKQNIFMNPMKNSQAPTVNKNIVFSKQEPTNLQNITPEQIFEMRNSTVVKIDPQIKQTLTQGTTLQTSQGVPWFFNKRVVVTGASSGMGRAVAMWFLNSGAQVALVGRDIEALIQVGKQFPKQALVISCDLSKDDQPYDMATTVVKEMGGVDILVNAAGILVEGDIKTTFPHDFDYMLDINLRSVYYTSFLFHHTIAENRGTIINISGEYGTKAFAGLYGYCMSKAGVETLTKHLALELAPYGVRVNCISPSMTDTNFLVYRSKSRSIGIIYSELLPNHIAEIQENAIKNNPLKRLGSVDDIGKAIIFLCSQGALHITGQVLKVDGGRNLTSSGWHEWKGSKNYHLAMETEENTFDKVKHFFTLSKKSYYTDAEKIDDYLKSTRWSSTDKNAHISVTTKYADGDARIDPTFTSQTVQKAFDKVVGPS